MSACDKDLSDVKWWCRVERPYTRGEIVVDGLVHGFGLLKALAFGSLLIIAASQRSAEHLPHLILYVATLVGLLSVSLAFNIWPVTPIKRHLARLDQAAIFLFIAGTYTPFLAALGDTPVATTMTALVWGASLIGVALKLLVPQHFGRTAIALYLAIGWSGVFVFHSLAGVLPVSTLWLLLAGGIVYSLGIIFHLWEKLRFQNALWHVFVVIGASLHLWAVIDLMVIRA